MKKKHRGIEQIKSRDGFLFVLPWTIGIVLFVLIPLIKSFWYAFSDVSLTADGIETTFNNFDNFRYIFKEDPDFWSELGSSLSTFLYSLPIIVILSLIFALILSSKFKGRLFARGMFFLPVIIASGVVITLMTAETNNQPVGMSLSASADTGYTSGMINFDEILIGLGFSQEIIDFLSTYITQIFDLIWSIGAQVLLFISGINSIPKQLYEVSKVEGATKWEEFLFVTIPCLGNVILLVSCYTMIELFITTDNPIVSRAYLLLRDATYDRSSAMLWVYFLIAGGVAALFFFIYNKLCLKRWN